jgi:hypothetical protein
MEGNVMDAVKFVKEYLRMCTKVDECEDCPVYKTDFCTVPAKERSQESAKEIVELVEEWSAAHTRKTRQSVFLEQYPQADIDNTGLLILCPKRISADIRVTADCLRQGCSDCRREFWMQEVE